MKRFNLIYEWHFRKPTHPTADGKQVWVNLWTEKVKECRNHKQLIQIVLPDGKKCFPVDPRNLLKHGKKTEAVYLYPDKPMKLVGQYFSIMSEEDLIKEFLKQNY